MFAKLRLLFGAALLLGPSATTLAADYYVDITNRTNYTIMYVYVSPSKSDSWGKDVLGAEVLRHGDTRRVTLPGFESPFFDIRVVDQDGDRYTFWNVDVSERDVVVTLEDLEN